MTEPAVGERAPERAGPRLGYMPWMDGIRGFAFLTIMMFHEVLGQPGMGLQRVFASEGFPVDTFFVVSGFLITTLLLQEVRDRKTIRFVAFYIRRARRLLPALFFLLAVIAVAAIGWDHGHHRTVLLQRTGLTLAYSTNWVTAFSHFNLQVLNHTWSLADEEQFYIVWPAILMAIILIGRRFNIRNAAAKGVGLIFAATVLWLQFAIASKWSYDRIYYGLDTRSTGLAVGCLLGALYASGLLPRSKGWRRIRRVSAAVSAVVIILIFHNGEVFANFAAQHGLGHQQVADETFLITGIATAIVLWELVASRKEHIGHRILGTAPLVASGRISYGLYLWNSVVVTELSPGTMGFHGWPLVFVHIGATYLAAVFSWFVIERPFRAKRTQSPVGQPVVHHAGSQEEPSRSVT